MELIEKYLSERDPNWKDGLIDIEDYKLAVSKTLEFKLWNFNHELSKFSSLELLTLTLRIVFWGFGILFILLFIGYLIDPDFVIALLKR